MRRALLGQATSYTACFANPRSAAVSSDHLRWAKVWAKGLGHPPDPSCIRRVLPPPKGGLGAFRLCESLHTVTLHGAVRWRAAKPNFSPGAVTLTASTSVPDDYDGQNFEFNPFINATTSLTQTVSVKEG